MDLATAAGTLSQAECFLSGQVCSSLTRIVVSRQRHDELLEALAGTFSQVRVGNQFDPQTQMGPLAASRQRDRVEGYIARGVADGFTLAAGGGRPKDLDRGWFVEPTVFSDVDNNDQLAREEVFGPVMAVIPYDGDDEAVAIANDSNYGLGGSVFTADEARGIDIARRVRTGTIGVNYYNLDLGAPFGGMKDSGLGRELGPEGLNNYLEYKSIYASTDQL